jgi:hypothetical protein
MLGYLFLLLIVSIAGLIVKFGVKFYFDATDRWDRKKAENEQNKKIDSKSDQ